MNERHEIGDWWSDWFMRYVGEAKLQTSPNRLLRFFTPTGDRITYARLVDASEIASILFVEDPSGRCVIDYVATRYNPMADDGPLYFPTLEITIDLTRELIVATHNPTIAWTGGLTWLYHYPLLQALDWTLDGRLRAVSGINKILEELQTSKHSGAYGLGSQAWMVVSCPDSPI